MDYIEAALAFAVVMIVLSTIVSGLVEVVARAFALRGWVLRVTLTRLVETELLPRLRRDVGDHVMTAVSATALVDHLTRSPVRDGMAGAGTAGAGTTGAGTAGAVTAGTATAADETPKTGYKDDQNWVKRQVTGLFGALTMIGRDRTGSLVRDGHRVDQLSAWSYIQRLAKSELAQTLIAAGDAKAKDILIDAARSYERYAAAAQELLRKRMNQIAFIMGFPLALALNVHTPLLVDHLVRNPAARTALIAQGEGAYKAYEEQQEELKQALAAREAADPQTEAVANAKIQAIVEELDAGAVAAKALKALDLPILYHQAPFSRATWCERGWKPASKGRACDGSWQDFPVYWTLVVWLPGVLVTGLMIGLGGPFWGRVFGVLSQLTRGLRATAGGTREVVGDPQDEARAIIGVPETAFDGDRLLADFKIAAGLAR